MSEIGLVVFLGLLAALLLSFAAFLQQRAARSEFRRGGSLVGTAVSLMSRLVRDRTWLTGWCVNLTGFLTQAAALHLGSVAVVQPLMSAQLVFAMPMASLEQRTWPRPRDWLSALSISLGLATLLLVEGAAPLDGRAERPRVIVATLSAVVLVVVLVLIASRLRRPAASVVASGAAGLCFAMTAVFMKLTADDLLRHGVAYTARDWVGYALAGSTLLGLVLEQGAFASGPLPWAIATMNSVNPIASYAAGMLAFQVAVPSDPGSLAAISVAGVFFVIGATGLAHSPSARVWFPEMSTESRGSDDTRR